MSDSIRKTIRSLYRVYEEGETRLFMGEEKTVEYSLFFYKGDKACSISRVYNGVEKFVTYSNELRDESVREYFESFGVEKAA